MDRLLGPPGEWRVSLPVSRWQGESSLQVLSQKPYERPLGAKKGQEKESHQKKEPSSP